MNIFSSKIFLLEMYKTVVDFIFVREKG